MSEMRRLVFLAAVLWTMPVSAQFYSGNNLWSVCSERPPGFNLGVCSGYILGIYDSIMSPISQKSVIGRICPPDQLQAGQLRDIVINHLQARPEERHMQAPTIVMNALVRAFPCAPKP